MEELKPYPVPGAASRLQHGSYCCLPAGVGKGFGEAGMKGMLGILELRTRAAQARWCVATLARQQGVSLATVERFFHDTLRQCPRAWLAEDRMRCARELLVDGEKVKETARILAYKNQHHFSFAFKKHHGYPPSQHERIVTGGGQKTETQQPEVKTRACRAEAKRRRERRTPNAEKDGLGAE